MASPLRPVLLAFAIIAIASAAVAKQDARDPHPLNAKEKQEFFSLICGQPIDHDKDANCAKVLGYPGGSPIKDWRQKAHITLDAVGYGEFLKTGLDEAYVTYSADFEPHAADFGGGILFERAGGRWQLVTWYPGERMDRCVALPGSPMRLLCRSEWYGMGEHDTSVHVTSLNAHSDQDVLGAQDKRREPGHLRDSICEYRRTDEAILLSIDDLKRSRSQSSFAASPITYISARDANLFCRSRRRAPIRTTAGVVRFELRDGKVRALNPFKFARKD